MRRGQGCAAACVVALVLAACSSSATQVQQAQPQADSQTVPTLYWLDVYSDTVSRATGPDFADAQVVVAQTDPAPDGVAVDGEAGQLYWTSMGELLGGGGLVDGVPQRPPPGTLQRSRLDGSGVERIVEPGMTRTPKQLQLDLEHGHVYWADREGGTLWRAALDGSDPRPVLTGHGLVNPVGVALDQHGRVYVSDRTSGRILRTGRDMPAGQTASDRTDVEVVVAGAPGASMPLDLAVDDENGHLYWTDRVAGAVQRAALELPDGQTAEDRTDVVTVLDGLQEPVGIALDVPRDRLYYTELHVGVSEAGLDGERPRLVGTGVSVTGVALVHLPGDALGGASPAGRP